MDDQEQKNATPESTSQSEEVLELIADWVKLYAGNYGKEPTEETILAYRLGLSKLKPKILHRAFERCLRKCEFWPNVAQLRTAYEVEADNVIPFARLPEHREEMTKAQSKEFVKQMRTTLDHLPAGEWVKTLPAEPENPEPDIPGFILIRTPEIEERVHQQKEQLRKKHPEWFQERSA